MSTQSDIRSFMCNKFFLHSLKEGDSGDAITDVREDRDQPLCWLYQKILIASEISLTAWLR